jgi:transcriptional/translational regulatory protein YebC/TACO1
MAEPGAVAWQFNRKGVILVPRSVDEEELMLTALDAGAEDIVDDGDSWRVTTPPTDLHAVRTALDAAGVTIESSDLTMVPQNTVPLDTSEGARKILRLIDALDDHDDVQAVHANFDIPDTILETVEEASA